MNTPLLTRLIGDHAGLAVWIVVLSLILLSSVFEWLYFRRNKNVALKRKVFWWSRIISVIMIVPLYLLTYDLVFALIMIVFLGVSLYLCFRNTRICDNCGKTNYATAFGFRAAQSCGRCQASFMGEISA